MKTAQITYTGPTRRRGHREVLRSGASVEIVNPVGPTAANVRTVGGRASAAFVVQLADLESHGFAR